MPEYHPAVFHLLKAGVGLSVLLGLVMCFFGYRFFKVLLGIMGFLACGGVALRVGYAISSENEFVALIAGLLGGVVGATLFVVLYYIGVFLFGASFAVLTAATCAGPAEQSLTPPVTLVLGGIGGVLAVLLQKFIIVCSTAFIGAWLMVFGGMLMLRRVTPDSLMAPPEPLSQRDLPVLAAWLVLSAVGALVQFLVTARRVRQPVGRTRRAAPPKAPSPSPTGK